MTRNRTPPNDNRTGNEDQTLWQRVMDTVTPLSPAGRRNDRVRDHNSALDHTTKAAPPEPEKTASARQDGHDAPRTHQKVVRSRASEPIDQRTSSTPKPGAISHADGRKLRRGRIAIEARLDLHGMRQSEAHAALKRFLFSCHHKGLRWVLVITGKGVRRASAPRCDDRDEALDHSSAPEPGVLRRMVPVWLNQPDLHAVVIGYETAGPQHGGQGALYVNIRRVKPQR